MSLDAKLRRSCSAAGPVCLHLLCWILKKRRLLKLLKCYFDLSLRWISRLQKKPKHLVKKITPLSNPQFSPFGRSQVGIRPQLQACSSCCLTLGNSPLMYNGTMFWCFFIYFFCFTACFAAVLWHEWWFIWSFTSIEINKTTAVPQTSCLYCGERDAQFAGIGHNLQKWLWLQRRSHSYFSSEVDKRIIVTILLIFYLFIHIQSLNQNSFLLQH